MPTITPKAITTADGAVIQPYDDGEKEVQYEIPDHPEIAANPDMVALVIEEISQGRILKVDPHTAEYVPKISKCEDCNLTIYLIHVFAERIGVRKEWLAALLYNTYHSNATGVFRYGEYHFLVRMIWYNGEAGSFGTRDDFPTTNRVYAAMVVGTHSPNAGGNKIYSYESVIGRMITLFRSKLEQRSHPQLTYARYAATLLELEYADFANIYKDNSNPTTRAYIKSLRRARKTFAKQTNAFMVALDDPLMQRNFVGAHAFPSLSGLKCLPSEGRIANGIKLPIPGEVAIRSHAEVVRIIGELTKGICPGAACWPQQLVIGGGAVSKAALAYIGPKSPLMRVTDIDVYSSGSAQAAIEAIHTLVDKINEQYGWSVLGVMNMRGVMTVRPVGCEHPWQVITCNTPGPNPAYDILRTFDTSHSKFAMYDDDTGSVRIMMSAGAYLSAVSGITVLHRTFGNLPARTVKALTMGMSVYMTPELYASEAEFAELFGDGADRDKYVQMQRKYLFPEPMPTGDPTDEYVQEGAIAALQRDAAHYASGVVTGDVYRAIEALEIHPDLGLLVHAGAPDSPLAEYAGGFSAGIGRRSRVESFVLPDGSSTKAVTYISGAPATINAIALKLVSIVGGVQDNMKSPFIFIVQTDNAIKNAVKFIEEALAQKANQAPLTSHIIDANGLAKIVLSEELYDTVVATKKSPMYNQHGKPINPDDYANKLDCEGITFSCVLGVDYTYKPGATKEFTLVPVGPVRLSTPYVREVKDTEAVVLNEDSANTAEFGDDVLV